MFSRRPKPKRERRDEEVRERFGLHVLYPGPAKQPAGVTADIIAIHGLGGHPFSTWTDKQGHMWLRDALPELIPHARTMTFGYNSKLLMGHSASEITDFATDLLERIQLRRRSSAEKKHDIIFVCHSLGGIVCKKALIIAHERPNYTPILNSVSGIVFMGTPHRGSGLASLAKPLANIVNAAVLSKQVPSNLLDNLKKLSPALSEVSKACVYRLERIRIVSFYEQNYLEPLGRLVVEPFSAILDLPNEKPLPISADHRNMVRFSVHEEEKFRPVWNAIAQLTREPVSATAGEQPKVQPKDGHLDFLRELYYLDSSRYLFDVPQPHPGTCSWIFEHHTFLDWIQEPQSSIFWLCGLPGRGKTVLTRYVVETLQTNYISFPHVKDKKIPLVHYFYLAQDKDRGSQLAILRSILHQLLLQDPGIHGAMEHILAKHGRRHDSLLNVPGLWDALEASLSKTSLPNTFIAIDALDEMEPTNLKEFLIRFTNMVEKLQEDSPKQGIKFFITSRPDIEIATSFGDHISTKCEIPSNSIREDLKHFVKDTVSQFGQENEFPSRVVSRIETEIIRKADGMFLWASLAWAHFKEGVTIWTERVVDKRLALLKMLPKGLEPLYGEMLQNRTRREIAEALAVKEGHRNYSDLDVAFSVDATIKRTCPNLVKVDVAGAVSFTHQSIKEFYMQHWVGTRFEAANRRLALTCLRYLNFDDVEAVAKEDIQRGRGAACLLSERFPLFHYAAQHFVDHLRRLPYDDDLWIDYSRIVQREALFHAFSLPRHSEHGARCQIMLNRSPLRTAMLTGSGPLVKRIVRHGYNINERCFIDTWIYCSHFRGGTQLHDFIEANDWVDLLLELGASPNERDLLGRTPLHLAILAEKEDTINKLLAIDNIKLNIQDIKGHTPLHFAVSKRMVVVMNRLLEDERVNVDIEDNDRRTPFTFAAYWADHSIMMEFLKSPRALVAQQNISSLSPIICAAEHGWKDPTIDLIREVPDINIHRGLDRKGILHWAVLNEWDDVIVLAVGMGAKLNHIDTSGKTPLHYAAELGIPAAARRLLRHGASVNISDNFGRTCLHAAAIEGFADVLNILIQESNFDVNEEDHQRRSLIHWAASWDWTSIMSLVLEQPDLDITRKDTYGRTALHVSALCGCPHVLQQLIDQDVFNINETDCAGNTLLHLAARGNSAAVANILVNHSGLWINRVNNWAQTALDTAAIYKSVEVMAILRRAGLRFQAAVDPLLQPPPAPTVTPEKRSSVTYNPDGSIRAGPLSCYVKKIEVGTDDSDDSIDTDESYKRRPDRKIYNAES